MTETIIEQTQSELNQPTTPTFAELNLAKPILEALEKAGYSTPTPIQLQAIPPSLDGRDLLLSAQTGSGKTAAFVLPILHRLAGIKSHGKPAVHAVILTPTRELALQVQDSVRTYGAKSKGIFSVPLVGGSDYRGQIRALTKGVQIIVATPGRFLDHLNSGRIDLSSVQTLVLDEADRMLDMGFSEDINAIVQAMPPSRQTIMSSATWDGDVGKIAETFTNNPVRVSIAVESAHIDESVYFCDDFRHKNDILYQVINDSNIGQAVIFAATKLSTEKLAQDMTDRGYKAHYLHGDLPQGKRNRIVGDIKSGKTKFLIATDVAARGIDIAGISHVINYDLPRQAEDYVHRIGRSGRAGRTGVAVSLCSRDDRNLLSAINRYLKRQMRTEIIVGLEPKMGFDEPRKQKGRKRRSDRDFDNSFGGKFGKKTKGDFKKRPEKTRESAIRVAKQDGATAPEFNKEFGRPRTDNSKFYKGSDRSYDDKKILKGDFRASGDVKGRGQQGEFDRSQSKGQKRPNSKAFADFDKKRNFGRDEGAFDKKSPKGFRGGRGAEEPVFHQTGKRRFGDK